MISTLHSLDHARRLQRREYVNPPVHEVVLSVQFGQPVPQQMLTRLRDTLRDGFSVLEQQEQIGVEITVGPGGQQFTQSKREPDGWMLKDDAQAPSRLLSIGRQRVNIHAVRPGQWPSGPYAGWPALYEDSMKVLSALPAVYGSVPLERAAIRYLNRIAVPAESELTDWFALNLNGPPFLSHEYAVNLRQTWAVVQGAEDLSATVGLATIEIPDDSLAHDHVGFLLDIEVFNLLKPNAPKVGDLPVWCKRSHDVEGDIFEWCITDRLRSRFVEIA